MDYESACHVLALPTGQGKSGLNSFAENKKGASSAPEPKQRAFVNAKHMV
jgi:hypothetical protein